MLSERLISFYSNKKTYKLKDHNFKHKIRCRMKYKSQFELKKFAQLILFYLIFINKTACGQTLFKASSNNLQGPKSLSSTMRNAYTVYPTITSLIGQNAVLPCNISHPEDDTLLMILVYFNPKPLGSTKPIGLTSGPPLFTLDLRSHSQYMHHYLHKNYLQNFKHNRRSIELNKTFPNNLKSNTSKNVFADKSDIKNFYENYEDLMFLNDKLNKKMYKNELLNDNSSKNFFNKKLYNINFTNQFFANNSLNNSSKIDHLTKKSVENNKKKSTSVYLLFNETSLYPKRKQRSIFNNNSQISLDDKTVNELLSSVQFVSSSYTERLSFNFSTNRQQFLLTMRQLRQEDDGEYVCRADFKWTRTLISVVNLFIIVPPKELFIENEKNIRITDVAGPYLEGDSLVLNCKAVKGKPMAKLYWYLNDELIDDSYTQNNITGLSTNQVVINELKPKHNSATLACRSVTHLDLPPLVSYLTIQLNLKPRQVAIITNRTPLRIGRKKEIVCESSGSRPPADIRWILGKEKLTDFRNNVLHHSSKTISTLSLTILTSHDEMILYCIAENPLFRNSSIIDLWKLEVHYRPKLVLKLLNKKQLKNQVLLGKSTTLKCDVQANPKISELHWLFNNKIVSHEFSIETHGNTSFLYLNATKKTHSGIYECMAKNNEGMSRSNLFNLQVEYKPTCIKEETYELNIGDSINVNCLVDASPNNCTYQWTKSYSPLLKETEQKLNFLNESTLVYRINENMDFGSIKCHALNELGKTTCEHFILPKARIAPIPKDCVLNHTLFKTYIIHCDIPEFPLELLQMNVANSDKKLKHLFAKQASVYRQTLQTTSYFLKIYEEDHNTALFTSEGHDSPLFQLKENQLHSNATYLFVIYSLNQYGQSPDVILTTQTQKMLRSKINFIQYHMPSLNYQIGDNLVPTMASIVFILICATLGLKILLCIIKNLKKSKQNCTSNSSSNTSNLKLNDTSNSSDLILSNLHNSDHFKEIEIELSVDTIAGKQCPDVIPLRVDALDNTTFLNYNKPLADCFKKTNLVTFSNQNKIELICSDDDPINITLKNPYETTTYAYNENGSFTLSTTV